MSSLLRNSRKTERGAKQFLACFVVRAAPFALLRNSRKTERGAKQFLACFVVRAAPFALLKFLLRERSRNDARRQRERARSGHAAQLIARYGEDHRRSDHRRMQVERLPHRGRRGGPCRPGDGAPAR